MLRSSLALLYRIIGNHQALALPNVRHAMTATARLQTAVVLAFVLLIVAPVMASAQIVNGDFETRDPGGPDRAALPENR